MSPVENIIYGILKYTKLNTDNMYTSIEFADNLIKTNNCCDIHDIYVDVINDILSTQHCQDPITTEYRIKSYVTQFIKIIDSSNKISSNPELVNLKFISDLHVDISNMLACRFILINKKSDRKFVDSLLDYACADLSDLKNILFNTLNSEYTYLA
jgi:hypothetical protein